MNDVDNRLVDHLLGGASLDADERRRLPSAGPIGAAALALLGDDELLAAWLPDSPPESAIARLAWVSVDDDDVADRIDAGLETFASSLVRADVQWEHPELAALLDGPERAAAAVLLAPIDLQALLNWIAETTEVEPVLEVARALGLRRIDDAYDTFYAIRTELDEADEDACSALDAALAAMSPERWIRGWVHGNLGGSWLRNWVWVADFLVAAESSSWANVLAVLQADKEAFDLGASLAVAAASALRAIRPDDPGFAERAAPLIEAAQSSDFSGISQHPALAVATAIPDLDLDLACEVACYEVARAAGAQTPAIAGLPLTASIPSPEDLEFAAETLSFAADVVAPEPEDVVRIASILRGLVELPHDEPEIAALVEAGRALSRHRNRAIALGARGLDAPASISQLAERAAAEDLHAWACAVDLVAAEDEAGLHHLIELWAAGPLSRTHFFADLVYEALERRFGNAAS